MNEVQPSHGTIPGRRLSVPTRVGVVLSLLAMAAGAYFWWPKSAATPPEINLEGVDRVVALAIRNARAAVDDAPRSAEPWGKMGMVLLAHQFREEACCCFAEAEALDVTDPRWPYFQALILTRADLDASIRKLRRTVELCGNNPDAPRLKLADALLVRGHADQAAQELQTVLGGHPAHPAAQLGLARVALYVGDLHKSLTRTEICKASPFTRKAACALRGAALQRLSRHAEALQAARLADELPDDSAWPDPYYAELGPLAVDRGSRISRVIQLLNENRLPDALAALDDLIAAEPEWDLAWQFLGHVLLDQRRYGRAEQALRQAIALAPRSADAHFYLGRVFLEQGNRETARAAFQRASELKPHNALLQCNIAHHLEVSGDRPNAIAALHAAVRFQSDLHIARRELGKLLLKEGRAQEALAHLRRAVELNPHDEQARQLLEAVKLKPGVAPQSRARLEPVR